jgi:hypothetical protein
MPFAGVNHHGQPILLSGALLPNEDTESFSWLFSHMVKIYALACTKFHNY